MVNKHKRVENGMATHQTEPKKLQLECVDNFLQWDTAGEEYVALKKGKIYEADISNGTITVVTEPDTTGKPIKLSFILNNLPPDFVQIVG